MAKQYKIMQSPAKAERGLPSFTFTVDGAPALMWFRTERAAQRKIDRLRAGRSNVFGGPALLVDGKPVGQADGPKIRANIVKSASEVTTETVKMKSGREKPREKRPGWDYELDGQHFAVAVTSENEARELCAVHAFVTRGKLSRVGDAAALVEKRFGVSGAKAFICPKRHKVMVRDESGAEYVIGIALDGGLLAKPTGKKVAELE